MALSIAQFFFYDNKNKTISFLDIHYRKITLCTDTYEEFFDKFLINENIKLGVLKEDLFKEAINKVGNIENKEIYFFVPALVLGGKEDIKYIKKESYTDPTKVKVLFTGCWECDILL